MKSLRIRVVSTTLNSKAFSESQQVQYVVPRWEEKVSSR